MEQFNPLEKWINATNILEPLKTMTLYYHTESTLNCLEALDLKSNYNDCNRSSLGKRNWGVDEIVDLTEEDDDIKKAGDTIDTSKVSINSNDVSLVNGSNLMIQHSPSGAEVVCVEREEEVEFVERVPEEIVVIDISSEI